MIRVINPFDDMKQMGEDISQGNIIGVVKNYIESIPGVVAIKSLTPKLLGNVSIKVGTKTLLGKSVGEAISSASKWYLQPAKSMSKIGSELGTKLLPSIKSLAPKAGVIAGILAAEHGLSRIKPKGYIPIVNQITDRLSTSDAIYLTLGGKPTKHQNDLLTDKNTFRDWIGLKPLMEELVKITRPSLRKIERSK